VIGPVAEPAPRSALEGHLLAGHHGAAGAGVRLAEVFPAAMLQVLGAPEGDALAAVRAALGIDGEAGVGRCARGADLYLLGHGPGQHLAVSMHLDPETLLARLHAALDGHHAAVLDLGHARTVLRIEGPAAIEVLAKGCPLDLEALAPDACAATVVSHFNVLVHRDASGAFDLYVTRSFAVSFLEWLLRAGAEFGVDV